MSFFKHLNAVDQTYSEHFRDSIGYSWRAFKGSFCFLCHAIWPDAFVTSGSSYILHLNATIQSKYDAMHQQQSNNDFTLIETVVV